jgi:hypothetical protein
VRVESSPDNDGTGRYCQTVWVRQARRSGATKVNQWSNPLKFCTGSNLADVGRAAADVICVHGQTTAPCSVLRSRSGGHGECLRRTRDEAVGEQLGTYLVERCMVNVGTISGPPPSPLIQGGGGARPTVD